MLYVGVLREDGEEAARRATSDDSIDGAGDHPNFRSRPGNVEIMKMS